MPRHRRGWAMGRENTMGERHSPVTISLLEPALLILLSAHPQHGYTLLSELQPLGMRTIHPSVVYRTLRDMELLEWIQSDWDTDQTQGPPRRIYRLTSQGEFVLTSWLNELENSQEMINNMLARANRQKGEK